MAGMGNVLAMMAQAPEATKWKSPQEMALEQAQTAHAQASAQQAKAAALNIQQESAKMEREAAQQRANQEAWKRAAVEAGGDPEKFLSMAQQYGVSQKEWADTRKALDDHAETVLKGTKEQQAMALTRNARQRALIEGVMSQADPVAKKRALAEANRMAVAEGLDPIPNDEESLPLLHGLLGVEGSIAKEATAKAEEARKQAAELRAQQEAAIKQAEFDTKHPVDAAVAAATLKNPDLLNPQQAQQARTQAEQYAADQARLKLQEKQQQEMVRHNQAMEQRALQAQQQGLGLQQASHINQVASQFDNEPIVKNYNTVGEAKQFVNSLGTGKTGNAADDQGLLYAFAKAMDPNSVVREGEYNTVQKYAQSWAETYGFNAARVFTNTPFLTDAARKALKDTIDKKFSAVKGQYDNVYKEYGRRIETQTGAKNGTGYLTDYAKATVPSGGKFVVKAPDGSEHSFDTQAQADAFKKLAGIK